MTQDLLPCPWCGTPPIQETFKANKSGAKVTCVFITCPHCRAEKGEIGEPFSADAELVAGVTNAWNTRTQAPQTLREGEG